jgi:hypothetical protein
MFYILHTFLMFSTPCLALLPSLQQGCQQDERKSPSKEYYQEDGIKIIKLKCSDFRDKISQGFRSYLRDCPQNFE